MLTSVPLMLGLRYARTSRSSRFVGLINFFSVAGVALGLAALILVLSVMNGLESQLKSRLLGLTPHIVINDNQPSDYSNLAQLSGVETVFPFAETEVIVQSHKALQGIFLHAMQQQDWLTHSVTSEKLLIADENLLSAGDYGILISRLSAMQLGVSLGDRLRIISTQASTYGPFGRVPSQRLFSVSGIYDLSSEMDDKVAFVHIDDLSRLLRSRTETVARPRLVLNDAFDYESVASLLIEDGRQIRTWRDRQGPFFDAVRMEKNMMALMLALIVAVAAFNIVSSLIMLVTEKRGDIAVLRTQGLDQLGVLWVFIITGLYNGTKGVCIGLVLGFLGVSQLNNLLAMLGVPLAFGEDGQGLPIDVNGMQVTALVVMSLLLCFLATLYPALRSSRIQPAQALKYE
jgi:lipoprotein-releasing system permease protein